MGWFKSVTKTVFFMMAFTICVSFALGHLSETSFKEFALMAFSAFFVAKQVVGKIPSGNPPTV